MKNSTSETDGISCAEMRVMLLHLKDAFPESKLHKVQRPSANDSLLSTEGLFWVPFENSAANIASGQCTVGRVWLCYTHHQSHDDDHPQIQVHCSPMLLIIR